MTNSKLRVFVYGPKPGSNGGIGMMMKYLEETSSHTTDLVFVESGGAPEGSSRRLVRFLRACAYATKGARGPYLSHINVSSGGSAYRKVIISSIIRARGGSYILHLHSGGFPTFFAAANPIVRWLIRRMFHRASAVVVLGTVWRDWVVEHMPIPSVKVHIVANAVPAVVKEPSEASESEPLTVIFAGRLESAKGVPELLEAWSMVSPGRSARLLLAGSLDRKNVRLVERIDQLQSLGVETTGWVSRERLAELYHHSHVIVLPSHYENLPLVLLEGMSQGLVPVATPVGAVGDIIHNGVNGFFVPVRDSGALASAIASLLDNKKMRQELAAAAYETWYSKFNLSNYRQRLDQVYLEAAGVALMVDG